MVLYWRHIRERQVQFSSVDPTFMVVGMTEVEEGEGAGVLVFKAEDVEREVRGDRGICMGPGNDVRMKVRPRL